MQNQESSFEEAAQPKQELDLESYQQLGYLVASPKDSTFQELAQACYKAGERLGEASAGITKKWAHASGKAKHLVNIHRHDESFRALLRSQTVRSVMQAIFPGEPLYVTHSKLSLKYSGIEQLWLPHQDAAYKQHHFRGVTVAIFLEDCDPSNGTIELFPGSHLEGARKHSIVFAPGEKEPQVGVTEMPDIDPVPISGSAGSIVVFHGNTIHQSGANTRGGARMIFIFEVEPIERFALEDDGRDALVLTPELFQQEDSPTLKFIRFRKRTIERLIKPKLKRLIFFLFRMKSKVFPDRPSANLSH